jgi:DNA helicase-2/ATP-dependent DNA helicase PcrA
MTRANEILKGLDPVQRKAAAHLDGPMVVFAGAGSGKTRIITHRIAYLLESGVAVSDILAVTFTNKAAREMRERVEKLSNLGSKCHISTFHASCARWLREFATELAFSSDFTIYDETDSLTALKFVLSELNVKLDDETSVKTYKSAINTLKTKAILPNDERLSNEFNYLLPPVGLQVYRRYQEYLAQCNAMDFGDLIMNMLLLLRSNIRVKTSLQNRYKYVLVDEYQDTNKAQFELISYLTEKSRNLFVVGDDDQSIYSWRGAIPANIIEFQSLFPNSKKVSLEENYRCSSNIVNAARELIKNNKFRVSKNLFTSNPPGDAIDLYVEDDNELEAWWVIDDIKSNLSQFDYPQIAIFYRTNSQSRILEDTLLRANIPYQIYGTLRFYDRAEVKDLLCYFRAFHNPNDDVSFRRILNIPTRGVGKKTEEIIELESARRGQSFFSTLEQMIDEEHPKITKKLKDFFSLFRRLQKISLSSPLQSLVETLVSEIDYKDHIKKKYPDQIQDKLENIYELSAAIGEFGESTPTASLAEWLQSITLSSDSEGQKKGISLMTLHMAKGLEFDRVYLLGLEEGLLPHQSNLNNDEAIEEERRLLYVGMTRAKKKLSLLAAKKRRGFTHWTYNKVSRFIDEIPKEYLDFKRDYTEESYYSVDHFGEIGSDTIWNKGKKIKHPTYGLGVIEEIVLEMGQQKLVVRFKDWGLRKVASHHIESL